MFRLRGGCRLALPPEFAFAGTGVAARLAFVLVGRLAFAFRLAFVFRFALLFPFSLPFLLGVGFLFGLSFVLDELLLLLLALDEFAFAFALAFAFVFVFAEGVVSPLPPARLMSTATVWPTLTISPACGS